ncbi:MAG TPA: Ig domain-containing protein, partial [bacterium]|nr:Ig domain-containing protein [bacterium]
MPLRHRLLFWTLCLILAATGYACDGDGDDGAGGGTGAPFASLTVTPSDPLPGETVTIDASGSTDNGGIARYDIVIRDVAGRTVASFSGRNPTISLPFQAGAYSASVLVVDNEGNASGQTVNFVVSTCGAGPSLVSAALPTGVEGSAYDAELVFEGGVAPITVSLQPGARLPAGLTLSSSGRLSGTLALPSAGTYLIPITIEDNCDVAKRRRNITLSLLVIPATAGCEPLQFTTASLPAGNVGQPYSITLTTSGGRQPITFSVAGGSLPPGLGLFGNVISGTPTVASIFPVVLQATDACPVGA